MPKNIMPLICLRCKKEIPLAEDVMKEISYTHYYCEDCIRKGLKLLQKKDKKKQMKQMTHWIPKHSQWSKAWECSKCGYRVNLEDGGIYHYCSSCGSKMEGYDG